MILLSGKPAAGRKPLITTEELLNILIIKLQLNLLHMTTKQCTFYFPCLTTLPSITSAIICNMPVFFGLLLNFHSNNWFLYIDSSVHPTSSTNGNTLEDWTCAITLVSSQVSGTRAAQSGLLKVRLQKLKIFLPITESPPPAGIHTCIINKTGFVEITLRLNGSFVFWYSKKKKQQSYHFQ